MLFLSFTLHVHLAGKENSFVSVEVDGNPEFLFERRIAQLVPRPYSKG